MHTWVSVAEQSAHTSRSRSQRSADGKEWELAISVSVEIFELLHLMYFVPNVRVKNSLFTKRVKQNTEYVLDR
jgi:hypothetical protein